MTKPRIKSGRGNSTAGFTLIELLCVVAVISILISLLLPAIQSSREQARRMQCVNNLYQLSLAIHNYAAAHRVFPPGSVDEAGPIDNLPSGYRIGWSVQILPFMERGNLWNQFNFRQGVFDVANLTAERPTINSFLCPSDGRVNSQGIGNTNYAGCHHDAETPIDDDDNGVLYLNSKTTLDDVTDGPAFTILVGEFRRNNPSLSWAMGTRATLRNTGHLPNSLEAVYEPPPVELVDDEDMPEMSSEETPETNGPEKEMNGTENPPGMSGAGEMTVEGEEELSDEDDLALWYVGGFSSDHPGGSNFLFCDGSVRFIKQKIEFSIFNALGNRADGSLIGDDQF